jgi:hypothetical protein
MKSKGEDMNVLELMNALLLKLISDDHKGRWALL